VGYLNDLPLNLNKELRRKRAGKKELMRDIFVDSDILNKKAALSSKKLDLFEVFCYY